MESIPRIDVSALFAGPRVDAVIGPLPMDAADAFEPFLYGAREHSHSRAPFLITARCWAWLQRACPARQ
jgi:hypothetical protein